MGKAPPGGADRTYRYEVWLTVAEGLSSGGRLDFFHTSLTRTSTRFRNHKYVGRWLVGVGNEGMEGIRPMTTPHHL